MPWINYADVNQEYNTVSVKYDPSLITILSEPFKVEPKKENKKIFTAPKIIDEVQEIAVEEVKQPEKNLAAVAKAEELRKDSLKAAELEANEKKQALTKFHADSVMYVEVAPQFPGGADALRLYISNNLKYPVDAINRKVQGTVMLNFVVEKDGSIRRIIITKAVDPVLDFEAVRIISAMPHWQAGKMHGKPIAVMIVIPIIFSLRQ